ncbi:U32 family peptidase [Tissierella sp. MSJ-40]|uniref:U32 family peptidase n=1 Tax=Tissierella simiarum TaxID=2841534 RepID=A0ABS6EBV1_9FIRM|nr:U32 family peptidase [Tissierella simiarum]
MNKKVELLAPVGSIESLYAAVQNGANAVYLGGKLFNARQYASNFGFEELKEAVEYAHLRGVKVYVTANILVDNSEMEEAIDYIKFLYETDVDAIIIQDLGLAYLIREILPSFSLHGSTQMTINNLSGAVFLQKIGFERVVLARETPIEEIKYIHENNPIELEGFIHGALCVCYSGQCLMSSLIGGRSGNRGKCAQPCRMTYTIVNQEGKVISKEWDKKHILSPKDLNTLDDLEQIVNAGIVSLKIEGRMKRSEYVATVVNNYRKALDSGSKTLTLENKQDVAQIFNRGFTKGLMFREFGRDFISYDRPDNRGILIGKVTKVDKYKTYVLLKDNVEAGDGLEFETFSGEYKGITVPFDGKKGSTLKLDKIGNVLKDSLVYKTSSISLLKKAKSSYEENKIRNPIDMEVTLNISENPELIVVDRGKIVIKSSDIKVEKGENITLTEEKIVEQLSKLSDTPYYLNNININLEEGAFLPIRVLNHLRREAVEDLNNLNKNFNHRKPIDEDQYERIKEKFFIFDNKNKAPERKISIKVNSLNQFNQLNLDKLDRIYLGFYEGLNEVVDRLKNREKEVYIWTDKILYQKDLDRLEKIIKPLENIIDGVSVSNIGTLQYIRERFNFKIHGDIGLNIFNSFTIDFLKEIGLVSMTLSPELNINQIKKISQRTATSLESIVYGYLPLMVTKHCPMALIKGCKDNRGCKSCNFSKGYGLKDRKGFVFYMDRKEGFSTIYNSVPIVVLDSLKQIYDNGVDMTRLDFTFETKNIAMIQRMYYDYGKNQIGDKEVAEFLDKYKEENNITKGHYFRGVM